MLDIHEHNGQLALAAAGLIDEFRGLVLEGREATRVLDRDGTVLLDEPDDGTGGRPEVQRGDAATAAARLAPARHRPVGAQGHRCPHARRRPPRGDLRRRHRDHHGLLVGADGAWSRVRPLLSDATPEYVGMSFVETYLFDGDTRHPRRAKAVGGGALLALAPGKGIQAHRESGGTLHTYVALSKPQDWFAGIDFTDAAAATARIAQEFDGWAPELTALITDGETAPVLRPSTPCRSSTGGTGCRG